ncbi:hypothetical protein ACKF11_13210 [Methylobacillus sp. Pita2]|uniref:hypothetical protein n=1 Tax=Methylobacillus sp. Pita2 TaxID=3383245 RepID=UPI0038B61E83
MKLSEYQAISQVLAEHAGFGSMSFQGILGSIYKNIDHETQVVAKPYQGMSPPELAHYISTLQMSFADMIAKAGGVDFDVELQDRLVPTVSVLVEGGVVEVVSSNMPVDVVVLDADCDGHDDDDIAIVNGKRHLITLHGVSAGDVDATTADLLAHFSNQPTPGAPKP